MIINHNMMAMNTKRQMGINQANSEKSIGKLSSGQRINSAADDAAGLSISEKMRAQIRGLNQASRNSQDGISMIQTAEGALGETQEILQRMRELATQAASDTNVGVDRGEIQKEMNQLTSEINRIGNTTEFNTQKLMNGERSATHVTAKAAAYNSSAVANGLEITQTDATYAAGNYTLEVDKVSDIAGATKDGSMKATGIATTGNFGNVEFDNGIQIDWSKDVPLGSAAGTSSGKATATMEIEMIDASKIKVTFAGGYSGETSVNINAAADGSFTYDQNGVSFKINDLKDAAATNKLTYTLSGDNDTDTNIVTNGELWTTNAASSAVTLSATITAGAEAGTWKGTLNGTGTSLKLEFTGKDGTTHSATVTIDGADTGATYEAFGAKFKLAGAANAAAMANGVFEYTVEESFKLEANLKNSAGASVSGGKQTLIDGWDGKTASLTLTATITGLEMDVTGAIGTAKTNVTIEAEKKDTVVDGSLNFQIGANQGQSLNLAIDDMRSEALHISNDAGGAFEYERANGETMSAVLTAISGVTDGTNATNTEFALDVSSFENATKAITVLNDSIERVSSERAKLGANQNRLEHTIKNLDTSAENLQASESRVRDVDMAKEIMENTKQNILQQAAQAMLAKANQAPQGVLQLLR
ncbi:hypothetical protein IZY60_05460 [Lutibacter sp. B2]|nr:hypothetical protein [Lutibacter sp. B2]